MLLKSNLKKIAFVTFLSLGAIACNNDDYAVIMPEPESNTIADVVENSADYSSLNAALKVAGLKATLDGTTGYTVFAPNSAAFSEFFF
ncbi:fasciclin domain-containing protein [Gillisia sp. Q332]|uniref:fasciclin domain-containing protein n=1 Tax=Gillisia xinjiangensis TaxID=3384765 RepID=UPI00391A8387